MSCPGEKAESPGLLPGSLLRSLGDPWLPPHSLAKPLKALDTHVYVNGAVATALRLWPARGCLLPTVCCLCILSQ